jgi:putative aldouronate transport system permease protein
MPGHNVREPVLQETLLHPDNLGLRSAQIIIAILPILAVYPFLQRYFVKGIVLGSVKG